MLGTTSETAPGSYQRTDFPEPGTDQGSDRQVHVHRGIAHPVRDRQDIVLRGIVLRTMAICRVMEPATGDDMPVITGAGTTTLTTGGSGQPLRR